MRAKEYTPKQMDAIQEFIEENFGEIEYIAHEIESTYVHTDTAIVASLSERVGMTHYSRQMA